MSDYPFTPLKSYTEYPIEQMRERLADFYEDVSRRRTRLPDAHTRPDEISQ